VTRCPTCGAAERGDGRGWLCGRVEGGPPCVSAIAAAEAWLRRVYGEQGLRRATAPRQELRRTA